MSGDAASALRAAMLTQGPAADSSAVIAAIDPSQMRQERPR
jgi:hypothetical protein